MPETTREFRFWRFRWTSKKLPSKGSGDRFQNQKERKLFAPAKQALFRVQENLQIKQVQSEGLFSHFLGPYFSDGRKMQNYRAPSSSSKKFIELN